MNLGIIFTDGDFTIARPDGLPRVAFPMMGDSIYSNQSIVVWDGIAAYVEVPVGTFPNIQPWSAAQKVAVLDQDFIVLQADYTPLQLNTPYNPDWALGWSGYQSLEDFLLVQEGPLEDLGGGIVKFRRTFATIPPTRNEIEQFCYNYPGFSDQVVYRPRFRRVVPSRIQYDYFIFDDLDILGTPVFPNGNRLDVSTGINPPGIILPEQYFYQAGGDAVLKNLFLPEDIGGLNDGAGIIPTPQGDFTTPSLTDWLNFVDNKAEVIAESSTFRRYMGNIFERRTRFVQAL